MLSPACGSTYPFPARASYGYPLRGNRTGPVMKTDSLFYRLFQALPRLFFDLVGLPTLPAEQYRFQSVELKQTALRLDGLFRPPGKKEKRVGPL
jgi:hypothetical protein